MALPMVHLITAEKAVRSYGLPVVDEPAYFLGTLAPDAVHMRDGYEFEWKRKTHLYQHSTDMRDTRAVLDFFRDNQGRIPADYLLGYCVHILTDQCWFEQMYQRFLQRHADDETPLQDVRWAYYNDSDRLDFDLFASVPGREGIWSLLERAQGIGVPGLVSAAEVDLWKERTLHWYDRGESLHKNPTRYLSVGEVLQFTDDAARTVAGLLRDI
jgi:hypothetical protein